MTSTQIEPARVETDAGKDFAHIVWLPEAYTGMSPQAYITKAVVEGFPVSALCGYTWIPHRSPKELPVCPACKERYELDPNSHGDRGELPEA